MENYRTYIVVCVLTCLIVILSACGDSSADTSSGNQSQPNNASKGTEVSSEANDSSKDSPSDDSAKTDDSNKEEESSTNNKSTATQDDSSDQDKENNLDPNNIQISSGESAIEYLKQQLEMENNDDIAFGDMGGALKTDDTGSYYTIKLVSKSIRENGGTGTVGIYKVYQDGTYKLN